jgi:hypothetical protein
MKKELKISGTYKFDNKSAPFTGIVTFEERENLIYYTWTVRDNEGNPLAARGMPVAFQQIPLGQDKFEFSKQHAIEGIRKYRIRREKIIHELKVLN